MSDSSDSEIEVQTKKRNKRRQVEESDEEYDEEESRYAKRRKNIGNYILDEAAVDDDEEEDEDFDEDNNFDDMIDNPDEVALAEDAMQHVKYDNRARQNSLNLEDEEEIEEHYRQKYENNGDDEFGTGMAMANTITQQSCLPGVKDANLWQIKCYEGEEKNTVLKLMHKFKVLLRKNAPMNILSVFSRESVKGYIYMEAYKESHVKIAAQDIKSIAYGVSNIKMISIPEMPDVLKVLKAYKKLERGQWVRINKGLYKNDLAKITSIDEGQNAVLVQILPRIDYKQLTSTDNKAKFIKQKFYTKPLPALFNRKKVIDLGLDISKNGKFYSFRRNDFDEQGFLYKEFKLNFIISQGVKPEMHEIERFNESITNIKVARQVKKGIDNSEQTFNIGDQVLVVSGSLKDLRGKVVSLDNKNIIVKPSAFEDTMSFRSEELRRTFKVGDHVRVLNGQHEGETGIVVESSLNTIVVLSDCNMNQFKVKPMDLSSSTGMAVEAPVNNKFLIGDLIHIDPKTVGVIIQFQKSKMKVLTNMNKEVTLDCSSSFSKNNNNKPITLDNLKQEIRLKDMVDIVSGGSSGKQGEIRRIWKGFVFIYNNQFSENRGLIATKGNTVVKRGSVMINKPSNGNNFVPQSPRIHSNGNNKNSNFNEQKNGGFKAPNALRDERKFVGYNVIINKGPLKGKVGILRDLKLDAASIELHSEYKTVIVSKENFIICNGDGKKIDSTFGTPQRFNSKATDSRSSMLGSKTPMYGSETPFHSRSSDGGRTPLCSTTYTPRTNYSGLDTPRAGAFDPVTATPRSVAFDPVTATPAHRYSSNDDLFSDDTGKSPSFMGSSRANKYDDDDDDESNSNWYKNTPNSPQSIYPSTPASPGNYDFNAEPLPRSQFIQNVEVLISNNGASLKSAVIQREHNGVATVRLIDDEEIINVSVNSVYRKEPESGSNVLWLGTSDKSNNYGKCLSTENGESTVRFKNGDLKMLPLKDLVPFNNDDFA